MASDAARALECKKRGGEMFAKGKIAAAIEAYSEAICFAPREAVYYTNRAMCHKKRESWDNVVADCEVALGIDSASIKGHYLMGVALDAQGKHDTAIKHLFRALELCKDQTIAYKEDIQRAMLCSRKRLWQQQRPELEHNLAMTENVLQQRFATATMARQLRWGRRYPGVGPRSCAPRRARGAAAYTV